MWCWLGATLRGRVRNNYPVMVVMGVTQRGRIDWLIITLLEFAANINLFRASAAIEREGRGGEALYSVLCVGWGGWVNGIMEYNWIVSHWVIVYWREGWNCIQRKDNNTFWQSHTHTYTLTNIIYSDHSSFMLILLLLDHKKWAQRRQRSEYPTIGKDCNIWPPSYFYI